VAQAAHERPRTGAAFATDTDVQHADAVEGGVVGDGAGPFHFDSIMWLMTTGPVPVRFVPFVVARDVRGDRVVAVQARS
jgi:hypothetical protein